MRFLIKFAFLISPIAIIHAQEANIPQSNPPADVTEPTVSAIEEGTIYRWTDTEGKIYFGDEPPPGVEAQPVDMNVETISVQPTESIYTWKDKEGNIHYGDQPPAEEPATEIDMDASPMSTIRDTTVRSGERRLLRQSEQ